MYKGKSHAQGGIPVVVDGNTNVEIEGNEYHLCRDAMSSAKIYSFKNKSNKEILDSIYSSEGCKFVQGIANSGDFIVCKLVVLDDTKRTITGTVKSIIDTMQSEKSCNVSEGGNKMEKGGGIKSEWLIDGKDATFEDFKEIYQRQMSEQIFNFNPKKVEYFGSNEQNIRAVEDYKSRATIYNKKGELKRFYMESIIRKAFNDFSLVKFGNAFRKHIDTSFQPKGKELNNMKWSELAGYIIGDNGYYISKEDDFRGFAKQLGIQIPEKEVVENESDKMEKGGSIDEHKETYQKWKSLVNMSKSELEDFYNSQEGKDAGLSDKESNDLGISNGRESARWIMRMKDTPVSDWTPKMWEWANKQISFISRMSGNKGSLYDDKGNKTRKHTSLLIWGHNPKKMGNGGEIKDLILSKKIELNFYRTTPDHALEYGIEAKNPLYLKNFHVTKTERLKGIGKMMLKYLDDYAIENGNDVIFGYINQKATFSKNKETNFNDTQLIKYWLHDNGYAINDDDNNFHKVVGAKMKQGGEVITYRNKFNKKYGFDLNESHSLEEIAKLTILKLSALQDIYNKGIGAYKTNPESVRPNVKSKEQWAMARVYSAVMGGKASKVDANELERGKMADGGEVSDISKVYSSSSRFKPSETIVFNPPLIGTNGAKLTAYTWAYEMTMKPNYEGELVGKRVSDWTQADSSAETGRDIVHKYTIELPNGNIKVVSSESVPILLGFEDRSQAKVFGNLATASKTLAKQQMKLAIMEAQKKEYDDLKEKFTKEPKPNIRIATTEELPYIYRKKIDRNELIQYTFFTMGDVTQSQYNQAIYKDGKTIFIPSERPSQSTINDLTSSWIDKRVKEAGGEYPRELYDLKNRVERQKRKVEQMLNPKMEDGGEIDNFKMVSFPEDKNYKYYVVDEDEDNYLTVQEDMYHKWKNANKIERAEYYSEWIPKEDMVDTMEDGGEIDNIFELSIYNVIAGGNNDSDTLYYGTNLKDAEDKYDYSDLDDLSESDQFNGGLIELQKQTNTYKFVYELDKEYNEEISDYPIEEYYEDRKYYKLVEEGEFETIKEKQIVGTNEVESENKNKAIDLLDEVVSIFKKKYPRYTNAGYIVKNSHYFLIPIDDTDKTIELRVSDHSPNFRNIDANANEILFTELVKIGEEPKKVDRTNEDNYDVKALNENYVEYQQIKPKNRVALINCVIYYGKDETYKKFDKNTEYNVITEYFDLDNYDYDVSDIVEKIDELIEDEIYQFENGKNEVNVFQDGGNIPNSNIELLAPNGNKSNLNHEQWHIVRTPAFKQWFGDWEKLAMAKIKDSAMDEVTLANISKDVSKIVDENGEPLVCNHSSREKDIDIFYGGRIFRTKSNEVKPIWFTYKQGNVYAEDEDIFQYQSFLNIRNLFDYSNQKDVSELSDYFFQNNDKKLPDYDFDMDWEAQEQFNLPAYIYEMGYDGYKFTDEYSIVIFNSNQIKLADGTNTTFDGNNDDIRYKVGGKLKKGEVEDEHKLNDVIVYHEKNGNWFIPKNNIYAWLYDVEDAPAKLKSKEFDYIFFPSTPSLSMAFQKGYVPPLLRIWTPKYQKETKGSKNLMGIVQAWYDEDKKKLYVEMMTTNPKHRRKGINGHIIKEIREMLGLTKDDVIFDKPTDMGKSFMKAGKFEDGGEVSSSEYLNVLQKLGITEEERENWRELHKVNQKQIRNDKVKESAEKLKNGTIQQSEYLKVVAKEQPIKLFTEVPKLPTPKEIICAVNSNMVAKGIVGYTKHIEDGTNVASRLDIPAYENYDTWVVSIHDGITEKIITYGQTAYLKNVEFKTFPKTALNIATGSAKSTIGRMYGTWENKSPEDVRNMAVKYMNDPNWVQIGMNPFRHSWFYDKNDSMPLISAKEVIQVGALVLAKNPVKTTPYNDMFIADRRNPSIKFKQGGEIKTALKEVESARSVKYWMQPEFPAESNRYEQKGKPDSFVKIYDEKYNGDTILAYNKRGNLVGLFSISKGGKEQGAFKIVVREDSMNKGWGKKLLDEAEKQGIDIVGNIKHNSFSFSGRNLLRSWLEKKMESKMKDGGEIKKENKGGDCYVSAGNIVIKDYNNIDFMGTPYLIHAEVTGQGAISGIKYGHAWIEDDVLVYDYSNGRKLEIPKDFYYAIGNIKTSNPKKYRKYTFLEAKRKMVKTGNYGCWDLDVQFEDGGQIINN